MTDATWHPRALLAADYYPPGFRAGGPTRSLENLVELLGDEVAFTVVTRDRDLGSATPPFPRPDRVQVRGKATVIYAPPGRRAITLLRVARRDSFDVLYLNSLFSRTFGIFPLMARRSGLLPKSRLLIAPRGELHLGALGLNRGRKVAYLRLASLLHLFADAEWHASTEEEASQIRQWMGVGSRVYVAPNLFLMPSSEELGVWPDKAEGAVRLAFVSRVHPTKNLDYALRILRTMRGNVTLDIYGPIEDRRYWARCRDLMSSLPSGIHIVYRGIIGPEEVSRILAQHDAFFFPTRGENFGHVVAEALAAGCPPLMSDQTPWDVASRGAGWIIPLDQPERYRETLTGLLEMGDRELREFRTRARQYAEEIGTSSATLSANRKLFCLSETEADPRGMDR
jgi:glycosyltransferase involved in cell wall biosynthesis